jgi:FMN reductase
VVVADSDSALTQPTAGDRAVTIVGIGGTTRANTSTQLALRVALAEAERLGASVRLFGGTDLACLPAFEPERTEVPEQAVPLIEAVRAADGLVIASPGYHGSISGLVKNALDYVEYLREDARPYFSGRGVGCIATGAGWQGAVSTLIALRSVVHSLRGWPTPLGGAVNSAEPVFDKATGEVVSERVRQQLEIVGREVVEFATMRASAAR